MKNLILIGYRCTGKSTVGPLLAKQLGWIFQDADIVLEERFGQTVQQIFATEGEASFREKESQILQELCSQSHQVIATGGGVILRPENRNQIQANGFVIWLTASPQTIWERMQQDPLSTQRRPNLSIGGLAEVEQLLTRRMPFYQECANLTLCTEGVSPEQLVSAILAECKNFSATSGTSST